MPLNPLSSLTTAGATGKGKPRGKSEEAPQPVNRQWLPSTAVLETTAPMKPTSQHLGGFPGIQAPDSVRPLQSPALQLLSTILHLHFPKCSVLQPIGHQRCPAVRGWGGGGPARTAVLTPPTAPTPGRKHRGLAATPLGYMSLSSYGSRVHNLQGDSTRTNFYLGILRLYRWLRS